MAVDLWTADFSTVQGTALYAAIADFVRADLPQRDRTPEGYTIDFKEKWSEKSLRVIAGFSNTFGGILVVGVSEENGRAKDIVGEMFASEIKTRLAGSISANITPTPDFDAAECQLPTAPDRRLCVIRVRPANRIHFLTRRGDSPIYIRNEDQAIPAPAAELQNLIRRERDVDPLAATQALADFIFPNLLPITKSASSAAGGTAGPVRTAADAFKIAIIPERVSRFPLDRSIEKTFRNIVFNTFPTFSFAGDYSTWNSSEVPVRRGDFYRIDYRHIERDIERKWLFTRAGAVGYASLLPLPMSAERSIWSLPDLAIELVASIRAAHEFLAHLGYLGTVQLRASMNPGSSDLYMERGTLPILRYNSVPAEPWPAAMLAIPNKRENRWVTFGMSLSFHTRTEGLSLAAADLLNDVLRELEYGAELLQLERYMTQLTKALSHP